MYHGNKECNTASGSLSLDPKPFRWIFHSGGWSKHDQRRLYLLVFVHIIKSYCSKFWVFVLTILGVFCVFFNLTQINKIIRQLLVTKNCWQNISRHLSVISFKIINHLQIVILCWQVVEDGYEFFAKRQLVTLFSAPNYCGEFDNAGAMMSVDETLMCSFQVKEGGTLLPPVHYRLFFRRVAPFHMM